MRIIFSLIFSFSLLIDSAFAVPELPNPNNFINAGLNAEISTSKLIDKMDESLGGGLVGILKLLYSVGLVVGLGVFIYFGILLLITSPQRKAQLKASLAPYFVGLLLFAAGVPIAVLIIEILISFF